VNLNHPGGKGEQSTEATVAEFWGLENLSDRSKRTLDLGPFYECPTVVKTHDIDVDLSS
jgi:hypothetical protein